MRRNSHLLAPLLAMILLAIGPGRLHAAPSLEEGLREISVQLAESMATGAVRKLAVIEFSDLNGYRSALGPFIAEELTTQLMGVKPGVFYVVERQQLVKVLREQKLSASSLFDKETIASLGKILGIQAIITGSIADFGDEIKINARSISVENAQIFAAASTKCPKKGTVEALMRQGAASDAYTMDGASAQPGVRQAQASDVYFQNHLFRLTVDSLAIAKNKKQATLALKLENLTSSELMLGIFCDGGCRIDLVDNKGNRLLEANKSGIQSSYSGDGPGSFSRFSPMGRSTITIVFKIYDADISGDLFYFTSEFLVFNNGTRSVIPVGISNIEAQR